MSKLSERISLALAAGRAAVESPSPVEKNARGFPKTRRYLLALVLGQSIEETKTAASTLVTIAEEKGYGIILVTDQVEISFFQIEDCITEYLPPFASLANREGALPAETYLERRFNILIRIWEPVQTIPFGEASEALFNLWQKRK